MSDGSSEGQKRRFFPDPGGSAATVLAAIVGAVLGAALTGGAASVIKPFTTTVTEASTSTVTETTTVTETDGGSTVPSSGGVETGLSELFDSQEVQFNVDADNSNRSIDGTVYQDAVTGLIYPDGSGFAELTILTKGRFDSMAFVVGIDDESECPEAEATVSVEDQAGQTLWGPATVGIGQPISKQIAIPDPLQVDLVQSSNQTESARCNSGGAQVSWGGVRFSSG